MIKFFYDSLETLQKVKFATKKDYISLGLGVVFAIVVCGMFFIGVDTILSGGYKTFYSIMKSDSLDSQIYGDTGTGVDLLSGKELTLTGSTTSSGMIVPSTGSTGA